MSPFIGLGTSACNFGRRTNYKVCGQVVVGVMVTRVTDSGVTVHKLAMTSDPDMLLGDSGGPFFKGNMAMGLTHGLKSGHGFFTPVVWAEAALNVNVLLD